VSEASASTLAAAANLSFAGSYRKLAEHAPGGVICQAGPFFAFVTGVPVPLFNGCLALESAAAVDLESALRWIEALRVPFGVWIDESAAPGLSDTVLAHGVRRAEWLLPGMVICPPRTTARTSGLLARAALACGP
jgi:hypothetical protein